MPAVRGTLRVLLSVVVVVLFFGTLITARTQQTILEALSSGGSEQALGYSEALAQRQALRDFDRERSEREESLRRLSAASAVLLAEGEERRQRLSGIINDTTALAANLRVGGLCDLPEIVQLPPSDLDGTLARMQRCLRPRPGQTEELQSIEQWRRQAAALLAAERQSDAAAAMMATSRAELEREIAAAGQPANANQLRRAFQDYDFVERVPLMRNLARAPPYLTQILLIALAGAFGSLVVLLIIIVYPQNDFGLTTGEGFTRRIALGALIAIVLYIVLTSGVAVLQGDLGAPADANVMAFALVGLIAGGFSDRVAKALSDQAVRYLPRSSSNPRTGDSAA